LIDFTGGIGVINAGHCPQPVVDAIIEQAQKYIHTRKETAMEIYLIDKLYKKNGKVQKNYAAWKSG
jgi:4-aminobutyrate aminotransferase-like enzyme